MGTIFADHPTAQVFFLLCVIFFLGCIECFVFKHRKSAYVTWGFWLFCVAGVISSPLTPIRICLGISVLVSGLVILWLFDRSKKPTSDGK